jgi:hypothetical protein
MKSKKKIDNKNLGAKLSGFVVIDEDTQNIKKFWNHGILAGIYRLSGN